MKSSIGLKFIVSLLLFVLSTGASHAWVRLLCNNANPALGPVLVWPGGNLPYVLRTGSYPAGQNFTPDFNRAAAEFNNITDTNINITTAVTAGANININNGDVPHEVGFANLGTFNGGGQSGFIAFAYGRWVGCQYTQSDLVFDNRLTWALGSNNDIRFNPLNFALVASHEIGHGLGLFHSNGFLARMNSNTPNGGPIGNDNLETPYVDEIRAMRVMYPGGTPLQRDLVASRYKNFFGVVAQLNDVKRASDNARVTTLNRGDAYFVDYTVENHGNAGQSNVRLGFYLSNDSEIDQTDFLIGSMNMNLGYGASSSSTVWLQLPNTAPTGNQYIGYVIDDVNSVNEVDEINNGVPVMSTRASGIFTIN